jgi:hypothetical protein
MKKKFSRILIIILTLTLATLACNFGTTPPAQASLGSIGGIITADQNGDGMTNPGEGLLEGVIVKLSGCTDEKIALSDEKGYFEFIGVPAGICVLEVSKGGWEYSAAEPESGHPIPVVVEADKANALTIYMRPVEAVSVEPTATSAPTDIPLTATPELTATPSTPMVTPIDQNVNCRFGPSVKYYATDALFVDKTVPILGRTNDSSWWQVEGPRNGYENCFVAANVTQTSGDLSNIPVVSVSTGLVTAVSVYATVEKGASCLDNHHLVINGTITTNGPATVEYRWWFQDLNSQKVEYGNYMTLTFDAYGDKSVTFESHPTICADFAVELQVRQPNEISGKDTVSIQFP